MYMQEANLNFNTMHEQATSSSTPQNAQQQSEMVFLQHYQSMSQPHAMPTPTAAPWNLDSMPWKLASTNVVQDGGIMQFSATMQRRAQLHQKRKSDPVTPPLPLKQFISEEKIAAHFDGLHISAENKKDTSALMSDDMPSTSSQCNTIANGHDYRVTAQELQEKLRNANTITFCDEIKKMHEEQMKVSFLPEALLNRITKPCTALVLWQPPPVLDLLHRKQGAAQTPHEHTDSSNSNSNDMESSCATDEVEDAYDDEFSEPDGEIDDFIDNNNTCRLDFNNIKADGMDEDL